MALSAFGYRNLPSDWSKRRWLQGSKARLGWPRSIRKNADTLTALHELIQKPEDQTQFTGTRMIWASRARELADELVGGISHVPLPVDSVVTIAKEVDPKQPLAIVSIITPLSFVADTNNNATVKILLQFNENVSAKDAKGLLGFGDAGVSDATVSGKYVSFEFDVKGIVEALTLPVGARIENTNYFSDKLITLRPQPKKAEFGIADVFLPKQIEWTGSPIKVEGLMELTGPLDKRLVEVYPESAGSISDYGKGQSQGRHFCPPPNQPACWRGHRNSN